MADQTTEKFYVLRVLDPAEHPFNIPKETVVTQWVFLDQEKTQRAGFDTYAQAGEHIKTLPRGEYEIKRLTRRP
jgi:hypothetical protein